MKQFNIITLCGSTKFKAAFLEHQKRLTLEGNIVISVGLFGHSGDNEVWTTNTKQMLDDMHKAKIDLADEIFVINVNGYVGESTKNEIEYAKYTQKKIVYLEPISEELDSNVIVKQYWYPILTQRQKNIKSTILTKLNIPINMYVSNELSISYLAILHNSILNNISFQENLEYIYKIDNIKLSECVNLCIDDLKFNELDNILNTYMIKLLTILECELEIKFNMCIQNSFYSLIQLIELSICAK